MNGVISVATIALLVAYVVLAWWVIHNRYTVAGSIGASIGFALGGLIVVEIAHAIASFFCWGAIITLILVVFGAIFN